MRTPLIDQVHPAGLGGTQKIYRFANNWGASVICTPFSSGNYEGEGLWELAVIKWEGDDYKLNYEHTVAEGDVRGGLTEEEVDELLNQIEATAPL